MPTIKELTDAAAEWNDAVERRFSHTPTISKEEAWDKRAKYENLRAEALTEWAQLKANMIAVGPDVQVWEAKLQHYQQLEARVNDPYARMLQLKERLFEEECNHPSSPSGEEYVWAEAWLEALEWIRGDRADPLKEDNDE